MISKIVTLVCIFTICQGSPVFISGTGYAPGVIMRMGRAPNMAFGYGSGFSSNIGGISHSTGIASSFQSGDAQAYSQGIGDGNGGARGLAITHAEPTHYPYGYHQPQAYNSGYDGGHNSAVASAQNFGGNYGSAVSSAQTGNSPHYRSGNAPSSQSAISSAFNNGYGSGAVSSAHSSGLNHESEYPSSRNYLNDQGIAISSARTNGGYGGYQAAVSAAESSGNYKGSTAQTVQQQGGSLRHSGASSINGPGIQAAQSHAVDTGYY